MFPEWLSLLVVCVRAGIYARISSDREGDQLGVTRQIEDCGGWRSGAAGGRRSVYVDDDVSAWSGKPRPEYERMLDDLRVAARSAACWSGISTGCTRQPRELEAFIDLCDELRRRAVAA